VATHGQRQMFRLHRPDLLARPKIKSSFFPTNHSNRNPFDLIECDFVARAVISTGHPCGAECGSRLRKGRAFPASQRKAALTLSRSSGWMRADRSSKVTGPSAPPQQPCACARSSMEIASVSTFHDHSATPAASVAIRTRCASHTWGLVFAQTLWKFPSARAKESAGRLPGAGENSSRTCRCSISAVTAPPIGRRKVSQTVYIIVSKPFASAQIITAISTLLVEADSHGFRQRLRVRPSRRTLSNQMGASHRPRSSGRADFIQTAG
jgi:hypothetical protein